MVYENTIDKSIENKTISVNSKIRGCLGAQTHRKLRLKVGPEIVNYGRENFVRYFIVFDKLIYGQSVPPFKATNLDNKTF